MDYATLTAALGFPDRLKREKIQVADQEETRELASWGPVQVELVGGVVKSVQEKK